MVKLFSFFSSQKTAPETGQHKELDPQHLPPMTAPELISYLALDNRIREIKRYSSVNDKYWHSLYQRAIHNAAELMQLIPASGSHHHAGPGGLLTHTMEVCAIAMRLGKAKSLPVGVGPEERAQLDQVWRYGLFTAALLHDIGKTLALVQIKLTLKDGSQKSWSPYLGKMPHNTRSYHIQFLPADYQLYHQLSVSLMDILPATARHWLLQDPRLLKQLMAWLNNDPYECGILGEIVRQADRESTASDLKLGGHKVRFPGTYQLPMIDRLMTALRHLLNDGTLKLNRNGAAGWIYQDKAYLVCRTVATAVQKYLQDSGATDIPRDPTRLYDTWQEHGYALDNEKGGAIWKVAINGDNYDLSLTVMVFEADRLFKVGHRPDDMKGSIEILSQDINVSELSQTNDTEIREAAPPSPTDNNKNTVPVTKTASRDPFELSNQINAENGSGSGSDSEPDTATEPGKLVTPTQTTATDINNESNYEPSGAASLNTKELAQTDLKQPLDTGAALSKRMNVPAPTDRAIGQFFLDWVTSSIQDKSLKVNQVKAQVHVIAKGVILISPSIVQNFCKAMGFESISGGKPTWKQVQAHFHKLKIHQKTENHHNIHRFQVKGPNRTTNLNGYLIPLEVFYPNKDHPEFNKFITHVG